CWCTSRVHTTTSTTSTTHHPPQRNTFILVGLSSETASSKQHPSTRTRTPPIHKGIQQHGSSAASNNRGCVCVCRVHYYLSRVVVGGHIVAARVLRILFLIASGSCVRARVSVCGCVCV
uniref:Uncharacterized protein n=1 Tax=Anopheles minimus TaxID=112268 RepID=A0A182WNZ9_9DIPT